MGPARILAALEAGAVSSGCGHSLRHSRVCNRHIILTGLGLTISNNLVELAGGNVLLTLVLAMIGSLILGMGLPTTANYIVTSTIVAPALVKLGILPIAAHMVVFYFGIIADITPPVCLAAFTGAGIAGASPAKTGLTATKLAIAAFILPYMFVYSPQLLLQDVTLGGMISILATSVIGIACVAGSTMGYFIINDNLLERILLLASGLLMIKPGHTTDIIGFALAGIVVLWQLQRKKRQRSR